MQTLTYPYDAEEHQRRLSLVQEYPWAATGTDHGFPRFGTYLFATLDEALAWTSQQPAGRSTSPGGVNRGDISWHITNRLDGA